MQFCYLKGDTVTVMVSRVGRLSEKPPSKYLNNTSKNIPVMKLYKVHDTVISVTKLQIITTAFAGN